MTKDEATELLEVYGRAWETQDSDHICTVFTEDATYNAPDESENVGLDAIRDYWERKVVGEEKDIYFDLQHVWVDSDTVIAEWKATFTLIKTNKRGSMTEVAVLSVRDGVFSALREYYHATLAS